METQGTSAGATRQGTILVIDDEAFVRELLTGFLTSLGFMVHEAASGEEGVRMVTEHRYDVVLTGSIVTHYAWMKWLTRAIRRHQPDATIVVHFMLHRLAGLLEGLRVLPERMRENLDSARGLIFSGAVLLALARHGLSRDEAYRLVQGHALGAAEEGGHLYDRLTADPEVTKLLKGEELAACFDLEEQLRHVDAIFERVLGKEGRV